MKDYFCFPPFLVSISGFPVKRSYSNALQAEEMDALISELARVAGGERALMADWCQQPKN